MSYTREQRAANAAKAANKAAEKAAPVEVAQEPALEPTPEAQPAINERPAYRNDDRTRAFDELASRRDRETGQAEEEPPAEEPAAAEPAPAPAEPAAPAAEPEPAPEPVIAKVKVKVDGEEIEVSQSDIEEAGGVAPFRILRAAKNRLDQSNHILAQTRENEARIAAALAAAQARQNVPAVPEPSRDDLIQAIRFGTAEEASAALDKIASKGRGQPVDANAVTATALTEMKKTLAVEGFKKEFADIADNPVLLKAAIALDTEAMQSARLGPQFDFSGHYRNIGNQIRGAFGRQPQPATPAAATPGTPSPASEKEARKASIVNLPKAAARAEVPAEETEPSREDILNTYRKARGLPTL